MLAADRQRSRPLTGSLGGRASAFLNPLALAEALRGRKNATLPLDPERRERCTSALAILEDAQVDMSRQPAVLVIQGADAPERDACAQVEQLCRRQLHRHTEVLKALRIARLELESAFDPAVHPEALDSFDWSMAHPHELAALPAVLAVEAAAQIQTSPASFLRLLQSDLPVKILITSGSPAHDPGCLPLACQDAFVLHSSTASPDHLLEGLSEMARTLRPSIAIVAASDSWTEAALLWLARACPLYRYNPDLGESWQQRFALQPGPPSGFEELTFAHVAALLPGYRNHFRVLPETEAPDPAFPLIPVTDEEGELSQAVYTRDVAKITAAVESRWRFLTELAAPQPVKEVDRSAEARARMDGATQAIHRVISILTTA